MTVGRLRSQAHLGQGENLSPVRETLLGESQLDDLDGLVEPFTPVVVRHVQGLVLERGDPSSDAEELAAIGGDVVEKRHLLGDPQRMMPRQNDDARAEVDAAGPTGNVGHPLQRIGREAVRRDVVLGREGEVVAQVVCGDDEVDHLLPDLSVSGVLVASTEITLEVPIPVSLDGRMGHDPGLESSHRGSLRS